MANYTQVKPEEPATTPGAATSVEHVAPPDHYASAGQHNDQKQEMESSVQRGERDHDPSTSAGQRSIGSYTRTTGGERGGA